MRKTRNHKCFIGVAVAMSLIAVFPVVLFSLSATGAQTRTSLRPHANLNPCPKQKGKVNITFWTWEGPPSVIQHIVNEFNTSHPDIHVTVDQVTPGFSGGYQIVVQRAQGREGSGRRHDRVLRAPELSFRERAL